VHLSNIELYYTPLELVSENKLILSDEEFHHAINVMRNSIGKILFVTDGNGVIYKSKIDKIKKNELIAEIINKNIYENRGKKITFCIPLLKNPDRLKFAIEKCVELGITNFILFYSKYSLKKKMNIDNLKKTALSAMKQSLRAYIPEISSSSFGDIINLNGKKIIFEQNSDKVFDGKINFNKEIYFLFGPEGGFDESEINSVESEDKYKLAANRLRSETAIVKCASLLNL
jgi:16S rRNA (uracil1498-N3)-methyltransferase